MAVPLANLVPYLKAEINPPGVELYPNTTDAAFIQMLANGFWEARLNGLMAGYEESAGSIVPISGTVDLGREMQQLVVLYTAYRIVLTNFQNMSSIFRAQAGPVSFETQKHATVLKTVLDALRLRMSGLLDSVGDDTTSVAVFDAYLARTAAIASGEGVWVR